MPVISKTAAEVVARACPAAHYRGRKVLLIVPDATMLGLGMMTPGT